MRTAAIAYPPSGRLAAALLVAVSRGSLLAIVALLLGLDAWLGTGFRLGNPLRLIRAFTAFCLVPGIGAWLLERLLEVTAAIEAGTLVLHGRGRRIEIPCDAIARVAPWTVPLPAGGVWLQLASGRRYGVQLDDPVAFIEALAAAGAPERVRGAAGHAAAIHARSQQAASGRWDHPAVKFLLFALLPALPLFRLHQWIAYGGTFGEYYMFGLKAYLLGFGIYWGTAIVYLVLYAAVLRAVVEPVVFATAAVAPSRTAGVRRGAETAIRILYYGGVPLLLVWLFVRS